MSKVRLYRLGRWLGAMLVVFLINYSDANAAEYSRLLNINFGSGTKTGTSAIGNGTNDVWNLIGPSANSTTTNLLWANSNSAAGLTLTITNLPSSYTISGQSDPMLGSYLRGDGIDGDYQTVYASVVVSNLPAGTYSFYCYAFSGDTYYDSEWFTLHTDGNAYGPKHTVQSYFDPTSDPLTEGWQYITFTNIVVTNGVAAFTLQSGYYTHVLNGMQIVDLTSTNVSLPAVTFSPVSGTGTPVSVTMSVAGHGDATIYYTTNGTTPTTGSYVYSSALSFEVATTLKAFATKGGYADSSVATATYPLSQLPPVTFSPTDGAGVPTNVVLTVTGHTNATIYFTTNGTTPTTSSTIYTSAIALNTNGWTYSANRVPTMTSYTAPSGSLVTNSSVYSTAYGWKAFDHSTGTYWIANGTGPEWVSLEFPSTRRVAKYALSSTTGGDAPKNWTLEGWNGASYVVMDTRSSETNWNALERREYVCTNSAAYSKYRLNVSVQNATAGNPSAYVIVGEVEMYEATITIQAFATQTNWVDGNLAFADYHARPQDQQQVAPTPFLSPSSGTFNNDTAITISSPLSGATYQYTTNGTDWVTYTGTFTLDRNTTLRAKISKSGYVTSIERTNSYAFVVATPSISPNGGAFTNSQAVILTSTTTGASFEYKIGGGSWQSYSGAFNITNTAILTVAGDRSNYGSSTNTASFTAFDTNAPLNYLLNLNFGSGSKTGIAATGNGVSDVWNIISAATNVVSTYTPSSGPPAITTLAYTTRSGLTWADGKSSTVDVTVTNLFTTNTVSWTDTMVNSYLTAPHMLVEDSYYDSGLMDTVYVNIDAAPKVLVSNLPTNTYDIYIYGQEFSFGSPGYRIKVGSGSWSSPKTTSWNYDDGLPSNWIEGLQYVKFTNVVVNAGENLLVDMSIGYYNYLINGMQIVKAGTSPGGPVINPPSGTYTNVATVSITNNVSGSTIQYRLAGGSWVTYLSTFTQYTNVTVEARTIYPGNVISAIVSNTYVFPDSDGDGLTDAYENLIGTNPALVDTDYDGRSDAQEVADGTNPTNGASVLPVKLACWRFTDANWLSEAGNWPLLATNLQNVASYDGNGLLINTNVAARLKYRDKESGEVPNINLRNGTVSMWFKPAWGPTNAGGSGPGVESRLIEMGAYTNTASYGQWLLGLNQYGTQIKFSTQGGGAETNHITANVSFTSNTWHQVVLTYTPTNSILYVDGVAVTNGVGVSFYPSATVRADDGINVGSDRDGARLAKGMVDDLETYNYPLSDAEVWASFEAVASRDSDGDGVSDLNEHEQGTSITTSNLLLSVIITQPRPGSIIP